jgi:hypothetical protein
MNLFIDESGYTGPDLVNRDQPVFVRASTVLTGEEANELITTCFPSQKTGRELKHSRLSWTKKGRAELIEFFNRVPKEKIGFFCVHKEFTLWAYLSDFWLEPMAYADGINLYDQGANIALANMSYIVGSSAESVGEMSKLTVLLF